MKKTPMEDFLEGEKLFKESMKKHLPKVNESGPQAYSEDEFMGGIEKVLREMLEHIDKEPTK